MRPVNLPRDNNKQKKYNLKSEKIRVRPKFHTTPAKNPNLFTLSSYIPPPISKLHVLVDDDAIYRNLSRFGVIFHR